MNTRDYAVGEWIVRSSENALRNGERAVTLEPLLIALLMYLAQHPGQTVTKDELAREVWKCEYISDDVLAVAISKLRKSLSDSPRQPRYIQTVSRKGYRLIAPVSPAPIRDAIAQETNERPRQWSRSRIGGAALAAATIVAIAIGIAVHGPWSSRRFPSADAREAYTKGRYFLDQRSRSGWQNALEQFELAVALDPRDPAAHAGLADAYAAMADFGIATPAELRPRAMREVRRALELGPSSAEAHEALGRTKFLFDWDFDGARRSLRHAIALNADYMPAHQAMAWLESASGNAAEAIESARRALQLDPVNSARYAELAWTLSVDGQHAQALREVNRGLHLNPRSLEVLYTKAGVLLDAGEPDSAFATYLETMRLQGATETVLNRVTSGYRRDGMNGFLNRQLTRRAASGPMAHTWRAQLYTRIGDVDRALASLSEAYASRESALAWVNVVPAFAPLRSDPRFKDIAARVVRSN